MMIMKTKTSSRTRQYLNSLHQWFPCAGKNSKFKQVFLILSLLKTGDSSFAHSSTYIDCGIFFITGFCQDQVNWRFWLLNLRVSTSQINLNQKRANRDFEFFSKIFNFPRTWFLHFYVNCVHLEVESLQSQFKSLLQSK